MVKQCLKSRTYSENMALLISSGTEIVCPNFIDKPYMIYATVALKQWVVMSMFARNVMKKSFIIIPAETDIVRNAREIERKSGLTSRWIGFCQESPIILSHSRFLKNFDRSPDQIKSWFTVYCSKLLPQHLKSLLPILGSLADKSEWQAFFIPGHALIYIILTYI